MNGVRKAGNNLQVVDNTIINMNFMIGDKVVIGQHVTVQACANIDDLTQTGAYATVTGTYS